MAVRHSVSLQVLTLGLLLSTSIVPPEARAAEASTGWAINRVASAAAGSYCTMAQRYNDSSVFTLAKNPGGEYSLAFDFPNPVFKEGEKASVSLKPAGGAARSFDVSPQNDRVAVIGLGKDDGLVKSLQSSGKLNVETGGKTFSFNTAKFAPAVDELSNCLTSMKSAPMGKAAVETAAMQQAPEKTQAVAAEAAKSAAIAPVALAAVPADTQSTAAPTTANNQLLDLRDENAKLKQAVADAQRKIGDAQSTSQSAAVAELQGKLQKLQQENAALKSQPPQVDQKSVAEAARLNQELAKAQSALAAAQAAQSQSLAQAQSQTQALQAQLAQATQAQQGNANAAQQAAELQKQNADLKSQLDAANQNIGKLQAQSGQVAQSQSELTQTKASLASLTSERDALKTQLAQTAQLQQSVAAGTQQAAELQKQNADLKSQLDAANQNIGKLQAQSGQVAQSQTELTQMKASLASLTSERDALKTQLAQLQTQSAKTQNDAQAMATLQQQSADYKTRLDQANQQIGKLQADLQLASSKPSEADTELRSTNTALQQDLAKLEEQLKLAQNDLQAARAAQASAPSVSPEQQQRLATLEAENAALKGDLAKADQALQAAQTAVANAAPAADTTAMREMRNQLELAETENRTLKTQLEEAQKSTEGSQIRQAGNNWDLEQATRRYQEAQREIRRLGALIDQQQQKSEQEKKEIESMLFDPAVASGAQVAMYNSLENRVSDLEGQIRSAGMEPVKSKAAIDQAELQNLKQQDMASVPAPVAAEGNVTEIAAVDEESLKDDLPVPGVAQKSVKTEVAALSPAAGKAEMAAPKLAVPTSKVNPKFRDQAAFTDILKTAGINAQTGAQPLNEAQASDNYQAYRWKTDNLFGSAEQRGLKNKSDFEPAINQYLARAKERCGGDFAAVPADVAGSNSKGYEIACIGGKTDTSASVLFNFDNGVMTTIAHEGKSDAMGQAIEARDRMAAQLGTIKTAAK